MDAGSVQPAADQARIKREVADIIARLADRAAYAEDAEHRQIRDLITALRQFEKPVR
jgi:hypothetical protein